MTPSLEALEPFRAGSYRERVEVFEHKPPSELVTPVDIVRTDALGRQVCACPAGQPPAHWLQLTGAERRALVEPDPPPKDGTLQAGAAGFTPFGIVLGRWTLEQPA
jgi:hypothetical protein